MPTGQPHHALRHLRRAGLLPEPLGPTDAHLLESFLARRDEAAFAALVARHGPMVWGVCRRVLRDHGDAEDAFQATFLLLARKAASILRRELVGGWLYRVAYRTALEARAVRAKRHARERQVEQMPERETAPADAGHDLRPLLDRELDRLPDKYRVPVVLCDLEGRGRKEVARQLRVPEGTLSSRLATARRMLARRLARHGLAVSGAALTGALAPSVTSAGVPKALAAATAKTAAALAAGVAPTPAVPVKVAALMEGVSKAMLLTKLKAVAAVLLLGLAVTGGALLAGPTPAAKPPEAARAARREPPAEDADRAEAAHKPRTDRFGDPLPAGAVARIGTTRWWHGRSQQECPLRYAADGKSLACCDGKAVRLLDAATGREVCRVEPPGGDVTCFALAPDGKTLVTASFRSPVLRLWEVGTGKEVRRLPGDEGGTSSVAFSPDGKTLAAGYADIRLWDAATWQETRRLTGGPDGIGSTLVFHPDGKTLVSGGGMARAIRWWDVGTGKETRRLDARLDHNRLLALSPDGKRLAGVVKPGVLHLWDAVTGAELRRTTLVAEPEYGIWHLCFSPDSKTLACSDCAATRSRTNGRATRFFAAADGQELRSWDKDRGVEWLAYSPDGKVLAQLVNSVVRLRDATTGEPAPGVPVHPDHALAVRFAPDGKTLIAGFRNSHTGRWDPLTGDPRAPLQPPPGGFAGPSTMFLAPALTGDGTKAASVDAKGVLHVWEPATGKALCRISDPPVGDDQASLSPDGKVLAVKHQDHVIRLWDAAAGKLLHPLPLPKGGTGRMFPHPHAFSPDGRVLATAPASNEDGAIRLWATATGKELGRLPLRDGTSPTCLAFAADGKRLVAAHAGDGGMPGGPERRPVEAGAMCLRLWDTATGRELWRSKASSGEIRAVAVSPDGKTVAAAEYDVIRLWELASGQERGQFTGHRDHVWSLAFSPGGRLLASGGRDHTALVWDVTGVCPDGRWSARELPPDEVERRWADLAGADGARAYRAVWALAASGGRAVPFLKDRVRPTVPADAQQVAPLIAGLDGDRFADRERATAELEKLGERAGPALRVALAKNPSAEARRRLEDLLRRLEEPVPSADTLRALRAVEVLETAGTREARAVLEALAGGVAEARLTREAKAALERLAERPAATP